MLSCSVTGSTINHIFCEIKYIINHIIIKSFRSKENIMMITEKNNFIEVILNTIFESPMNLVLHGIEIL